MIKFIKRWLNAYKPVTQPEDKPNVQETVEKTPLQDKVDEIVNIIDNDNTKDRVEYIYNGMTRVYRIGDGVWIRPGEYTVGIVYDDPKSCHYDVFDCEENRRIVNAFNRRHKRLKEIEKAKSMNDFLGCELK